MKQANSLSHAVQPGSSSLFGKLTKYMDDLEVTIMEIFKWNAAILMVLIVFEVTMRYVFRRPTIWGQDVQTYLSAIGRVIGFGYVTMVHAHVTMDIFTHNLPFKKWKALELFNYVVFMLPLLIAITTVTLQRALYAIKIKEQFYSVWRPPTGPLITFIVCAYVLMILQVLIEVIKNLICLRRGSDTWLKDR